MPLAGIVTLVGVGLIVAALAVSLISVALLLRRVSFNLGTVIAGVNAIGYQTEPLDQRFQRIDQNVDGARRGLQQSAEQLRRQLAASQRAAGDTKRASKPAASKSTARKSRGGSATSRSKSHKASRG